MQFQFIGTRKRFPAVRARVGHRVERTGMPPRRAVHIESLVAPRARVQASDRIDVGDGVRSEDVDLIETLIAQSAHVVLSIRVHLEMTRQCRVVHEATLAHLQRSTTNKITTERPTTSSMVQSSRVQSPTRQTISHFGDDLPSRSLN